MFCVGLFSAELLERLFIASGTYCNVCVCVDRVRESTSKTVTVASGTYCDACSSDPR